MENCFMCFWYSRSFGGLGYVSLFKESQFQGRRQCGKEKTNGLWNQVDMVGSTALPLISNDLSQCWGLSFLTSKMMIKPYPACRNFAGTELRKYVNLYFKDKSLCVCVGVLSHLASFVCVCVCVCVCLNVYLFIYVWLCWVVVAVWAFL